MKRRHALLDVSAWALILPALFILWLVDAPLLKTLLIWATFSLIMAGASVIISRIIFPQIDLSKLMDRVEQDHVPSAIVASGLLIFIAMLFYSIVFWAKA